MAKRRDTLKRFSGYSEGGGRSAILDPDTEILGDEYSHWWKNLENNTMGRFSVDPNTLNETSRHLVSASQMQTSQAADGWWKALETSNTMIPIQVNTENIRKDPVTNSTSISESDDEPRIVKKKYILQSKVQKRKANPFMNVLEETIDRTSRTEHVVGNESRISNLELSQKSDEKISNSSMHVSDVLRLKRNILKKNCKNNKVNPFLDVLNDDKVQDFLNEKSLNTSVSYNTEVIPEQIVRAARKSLICSQADGNHTISPFEGDHNNSRFPVPNAQSTVLEGSGSYAGDSNKDSNSSDIGYEILKPKSKWMELRQLNAGTNPFQQILEDEESSDETDERNVTKNVTQLQRNLQSSKKGIEHKHLSSYEEKRSMSINNKTGPVFIPAKNLSQFTEQDTQSSTTSISSAPSDISYVTCKNSEMKCTEKLDKDRKVSYNDKSKSRKEDPIIQKIISFNNRDEENKNCQNTIRLSISRNKNLSILSKESNTSTLKPNSKNVSNISQTESFIPETQDIYESEGTENVLKRKDKNKYNLRKKSGVNNVNKQTEESKNEQNEIKTSFGRHRSLATSSDEDDILTPKQRNKNVINASTATYSQFRTTKRSFPSSSTLQKELSLFTIDGVNEPQEAQNISKNNNRKSHNFREQWAVNKVNTNEELNESDASTIKQPTHRYKNLLSSSKESDVSTSKQNSANVMKISKTINKQCLRWSDCSSNISQKESFVADTGHVNDSEDVNASKSKDKNMYMIQKAFSGNVVDKKNEESTSVQNTIELPISRLAVSSASSDEGKLTPIRCSKNVNNISKEPNERNKRKQSFKILRRASFISETQNIRNSEEAENISNSREKSVYNLRDHTKVNSISKENEQSKSGESATRQLSNNNRNLFLLDENHISTPKRSSKNIATASKAINQRNTTPGRPFPTSNVLQQQLFIPETQDGNESEEDNNMSKSRDKSTHNLRERSNVNRISKKNGQSKSGEDAARQSLTNNRNLLLSLDENDFSTSKQNKSRIMNVSKVINERNSTAAQRSPSVISKMDLGLSNIPDAYKSEEFMNMLGSKGKNLRSKKNEQNKREKVKHLTGNVSNISDQYNVSASKANSNNATNVSKVTNERFSAASGQSFLSLSKGNAVLQKESALFTVRDNSESDKTGNISKSKDENVHNTRKRSELSADKESLETKVSKIQSASKRKYNNSSRPRRSSHLRARSESQFDMLEENNNLSKTKVHDSIVASTKEGDQFKGQVNLKRRSNNLNTNSPVFRTKTRIHSNADISEGQHSLKLFFEPSKTLSTQDVLRDENKVAEIKKVLDKVKAQEITNLKINLNIHETKPEAAAKSKKMATNSIKKKLQKSPAKGIDKAFLVNGKVYKVPKLPRPQHWITQHLYKYLWKKLEPNYNLEARVISEKFVCRLSEVTKFILKAKRYHDYKNELNALMKEMARLGIVNTSNDFYHFCLDFFPYELRVKTIPILLPGNKRSIPYNPDILHEPIIRT